MGDGCRVDFEYCDRIEPAASGKYRYTISEVSYASALSDPRVWHSDDFPPTPIRLSLPEVVMCCRFIKSDKPGLAPRDVLRAAIGPARRLV